MPLSIEELERNAYINGELSLAAALGKIMDYHSEDSRIEQLEEQIKTLKREIRERDQERLRQIQQMFTGD